MKIKYKCACMKQDRELDVPERVKGTDLMPWMDMVTHCVSYDHRARNAVCFRDKIEYLAIPHSEGEQEVGTVPTKN